MRLNRAELFCIVALLVWLVAAESNGQPLPLPAGQQAFTYHGLSSPLISDSAATAAPIGIGAFASGGATLRMEVGLGPFSGPVDIYAGLYAPSIDPATPYLFTAGGGIQPFAAGFVPWKTAVSAVAGTTLIGDLPVSALPVGTYYFFVMASPAGSLDRYYLWVTDFTAPLPSNVLPFTVNGSLCSSAPYFNKPCVSVTVCSPGTDQCQKVDDVLVDTASFGLRIFKEVLSVPLAPIAVASGTLTECAQFGSGNDWGPVAMADVVLGGEPLVRVPIQIIDATFGTIPRSSGCTNPEQGPADAGLNGILGVGVFAQDCGSVCASRSNNGLYYSCGPSGCTGTSAPLSLQVTNPVALLPHDNNGVVVQLPTVPSAGAPSVDGRLILGIGTQPNNVPASASSFPLDADGRLRTEIGGMTYISYIDTGSNALYFAAPYSSQLPACSLPNAMWFCPSTPLDLSATNRGAAGLPGDVVSFQIGNFVNLLSSPVNNVFMNVGGKVPDMLIWGMPFFFGRSVFYGYENTGSTLGTGPLIAY